jgi:aminoglycoside 3-N-acetyltransferase I
VDGPSNAAGVTQMNYTYRHLSTADVPVLKSLLRVFGEAFNDMEAYQGAVPDDGYLLKLLAKPHFIVVVAMNDAEVVGGLAAYELEKFEQDRREIYIYDLAVAEAHRRRGIATTLIRELQRLARERKAYVIYVQADREDDPAIRLYESLGTREDVHHFDIPADEI